MTKTELISKFKKLFSVIQKNIKSTKELNSELFSEISNHSFEIEDLTSDFSKIVDYNKSIFVFSDNSPQNVFNIKDILNEFKNLIEQKHKNELENKGFFDRLNNEMKTIINITDLFEKLNDIADDMKLLSLNAHILSYNLGEKGKNHMEITKEIFTISTNITNYVELIEGLTLNIMRFTNDVHFIINKIADLSGVMLKESEIKSELIESLLSDLSSFFSNIFKSILSSIDIISNIQEVFMNQIQEEDILRQKLEHSEQICEEVLTLIEDKNRDFSKVDLLYLFLEASSILDNISYNSFDKYDKFINNSRESINTITSTLDDISNLNKEIINTLNDDKNKLNSKLNTELNKWKNSLSKEDKIITLGKEKILDEWSNNNNYSTQISSNINAFNKIKKTLNLLAMLSNIHAQKNDLVKEDYTFAIKLKEIAKIIGSSVEKGFAELSQHLDMLKTIMKEYKNKNSKQNNIDSYMSNIALSDKQFNDKENELLNKSNKFNELIGKTKLKLINFSQNIDDNSISINNLKTNFKNDINNIFNEIEMIKKQENIEILEEKSSKFLHKIVDNFNLHYDKVKAYQDKEQTEIIENNEPEEIEDDDNFTLF